jgi:GT2 family glycosyltransferase
MQQIDLSIVIASWNGKQILKKCLNSIFGQYYDFAYEVIVVENGSVDGTVELLKNSFKKVRLKINSENLGFAVANNLGIEMARGRFILLLNQDVELEKGTLAGMLKFLEKQTDRKIAVVAPMLKYPNGNIQLSLRPFPTPWNVFVDALTLGTSHKKYYNHTKSQVVDQPMASCLMINGKILRELKGFDTNPSFFLFFNDVDLSFRISQLGFEHYYLANYVAIHRHGQSTRKWPQIARLLVWSKGLYYFLIKHYAKKRILVKFALRVEVFFIFLGRVVAETLKSIFK